VIFTQGENSAKLVGLNLPTLFCKLDHSISVH
jgi:hypothetical protein